QCLHRLNSHRDQKLKESKESEGTDASDSEKKRIRSHSREWQQGTADCLSELSECLLLGLDVIHSLESKQSKEDGVLPVAMLRSTMQTMLVQVFLHECFRGIRQHQLTLFSGVFLLESRAIGDW